MNKELEFYEFHVCAKYKQKFVAILKRVCAAFGSALFIDLKHKWCNIVYRTEKCNFAYMYI